MLKLLFTLLFTSIICSSNAQLTITGTVTNSNKEVIAGANVFISNTSFTTITDAAGNFKLNNINLQKGELVVSALGYKLFATNVNTASTAFNIMLEVQPKVLDAVTIQTFDKNGYKKWGRLFFELFVGNTQEATSCTIENKEVIQFYYDRDNGILNAVANEPIIIKNEALGYEINYSLENFTYNAKEKTIFFYGYPVFKELKRGKAKQKTWQKNRLDCYNGSVMHFMRSVYSNTLATNNFIIRPARKIINNEKVRVKKIMKLTIADNGSSTFITNTDSTNYYYKILRQTDSIFVATAYNLPIDSFAFALDTVRGGLYFENYLAVQYNKFVDQQLSTVYISYCKLMLPEIIEIYQNGSYYNATNLFTEAYWADTEKISRLLPLDYEPPLKN